ncbi:MAG: hypothetical protein ACYC7A_11560 [Thermoanaerobaculia bacterium]
MRHLVLAVALFLIPITVEAQYTVAVIPEHPPEGQPFTVRIAGQWRDMCPPASATVFATKTTIIPTLIVSSVAPCPAAVTAFTVDAQVPSRPRGDHQIHVRVADYDGVHQLAETIVTVVPVVQNPLSSVGPDFGEGPTRVRIFGPFACVAPCEAPEVFAGDAKASEVIEAYNTIEATLPAQAPGAVDVVVRRGAKEWRLPGGFLYVSETEFERILIPVYSPVFVPGYNGSSWTTTLQLFNGNHVPIQSWIDLFDPDGRCQWLCTGFPPVLPGEEWAPPMLWLDESVPAVMLYLHHTLANQVSLEARVRDVSRQDTTWGTEVPVVRMTRVRRPARLIDVPLTAGFRVMLRVYGLRPEAGSATVRFFNPETNALLHTMPLALTPPSHSFPLMTQPRYAQVALLESLPELRGVPRVRIEVDGPDVWALASVTHNESQHVTLVSPQ